MELKVALLQKPSGLVVSIHIDDLDITKLSQLTERDIKESARPLIESYFRIEQGCAQAESISNSLCYGAKQPRLPCVEDGCSLPDSGRDDAVPFSQ